MRIRYAFKTMFSRWFLDYS